jgi:hypothetical protein
VPFRTLASLMLLTLTTTASAGPALAVHPSQTEQGGPPPPVAPSKQPPPSVGHQGPPGLPGSPSTLRVFLDCDRCDTNYVTTNVTFVDYVRDRTVADVHILVTAASTGGAGLAWTVKFIGLGRFQGHDHSLAFSTPTTATDDDQRREFVRVFKLGLVFFAADTPAAARLNVTFTTPEGGAQTTATKDPWNYWLFQLNANGNFNGQQSNSSLSYYANVSANRTTDAWKVSFNGSSNENRNRFVLDDGSTVKSATRGWSVNQLVVKSLNAHWSVGGSVSASASTYSNERRDYRVAPGIEFDVFPYRISTRRILTFLYTVGASHYDYNEITIFGKVTETVLEHALNVGLSLKEPWGSLSETTGFTQQLNQLSRYRLSASTQANVRLFKGFSFNLYLEYEKIRNQIFLPLGGASTTDILLQIRQLATGYSYQGGVGLTYSFGSIFNNIVNPRFGAGGQ